MTEARIPTGVKRLDALLNGGLPAGAAVLVYGPQFLGKEALGRRIAAAAVARKEPAIMVLTHDTASDMRPQIQSIAKGATDYYVDGYARTIGDSAEEDRTEYLDGLADLAALSLAVNRLETRIIGKYPSHVVVIDSASTLVAYTNAATTFRFLQALIGRVRRVGATTVVLLDEGMQSDAEVQMFKHLMQGFIELREQGGRTQLQVQGMGVPPGKGWVDYTFGEQAFDVTGTFAAGRIR